MDIRIIYIVVVAAASLPSIIAQESGIEVVLKHCTCSANKKYVEKIFTPRKPVNRTTSITATDVYFLPNVSLDSPVYIHLNAYKKFATQYKLFMLTLKAEICESIRLKSHPLYKFFSDESMGTESNVLDPCPIKGRRFVKPYYTNYKNLPSLLPTGMWRIDAIVTKGLEEEVLRMSSYYEVSSKGILEF